MSKIKEMVEREMTLGDIVVSDNIYVEHSRGESLKNLATKYGKSVDEIKGILKSLGVIARNEKKII